MPNANKNKSSVLQVPMDKELRKQGEEVYRNIGTTLNEAIRIFIFQSIKAGGFPFPLNNGNKERKNHSVADFHIDTDKAFSSPENPFYILAQSEDEDVRAFATSNPQAPADLLRTLASDKSEVVRAAVAHNPSYSKNN